MRETSCFITSFPSNSPGLLAPKMAPIHSPKKTSVDVDLQNRPNPKGVPFIFKTMDFQRRAASHRSLPMKTNGKFYPSITTGVLALNQCTYQLVQECPGYFLSINVSLGYSKCHPFNKKRASENSWEVNGRSWRGEKSYIPNVRIWKPTWNYNILLRCAWNVTSSFGDRSSCRVILNNQPVSCLPLVGSTTRVNTAR